MVKHILLQANFAIEILLTASPLIHLLANSNIYQIILNIIKFISCQRQSNPKIIVFLTIPILISPHLHHITFLQHYSNKIHRATTPKVLFYISIILRHHTSTNYILRRLNKFVNNTTNHTNLRMLFKYFQLLLKTIRYR